MEKILARIEHDKCTATIYESELPGQFSIHYQDATGKILGEDQLTGVSTYRQREEEILARLKALCAGQPSEPDQLSDSGEY